jgi:DNA-binding beta-propeller fold protein YncE
VSEGQGRKRLGCFSIALFLFCVTALWALPNAALAFPYEFRENYGAPGLGDGQLELGEHSGIAVNLTTHDIYVADSENHRLVVFNSSGGFVRAFGADVGGPGIDVCTSSCVAGISEDAPGAFENPTFIAIDNNPLSPSFGNVYVADNGTNTVSKFEADGDLITSWGEGGRLKGSPSHLFNEVNGNPADIAGIAVDTSGNLFVKQTKLNGFMFKFAQAGAFLTEFTTTFETNPQNALARGIAVDSTGAIYMIRGTGVVAKLNSAGKPIIESIGCGACAQAITVDPSNNDLYIALGAKVERYNSAAVLQETFGSLAEIKNATGIAVDAGLETAYIADQGAGSDRIDVFGPPPPGPPEVKSTGVENITATAADLLASVNPHLFETKARFQYLTLEQFEAEGFTGAAETPEADIGAGKVPVSTGAHLSGLLPSTTYVFRVVAVNEAGEDTTEEPAPSFATFTTPPAGLPDGRAYEMVSPQQKAGEVLPPEPSTQLGGSCGDCLPGANSPTMPMQSNREGNSVLYLGQPFSEGLFSGPNEYIAPRSSSGWGTQSLSTATTIGEYEAFSEDLTRGVLFQVQPPLSPDAPMRGEKAFANLYLREGGAVQPLITEEPPNRNPRAPGEFKIRFATANAGTALEPGFSALLLEANDALTEAVPGIAPAAPEVAPGGACSNPGVECNLYEWFEGELALVNVLPGNEDAVGGAVVGAGRLLGLADQHPDVSHAVSDDGGLVFFSAQETGEVYARIEGEETLEIPTPGPGTCKESEPLEDRVCFLTASADGTAVLLSDGGLYELSEEEDEYEAVADLTLDESEVHQGGFQGILGAAEDLSRVYFVDTAALSGEGVENANGEHAEAGKLNLYGWDEGALTFIGRLVLGDGQFGPPEYGAWKASPSQRVAQVSADGDWLAFMSLAELTGYNNTLRGGGKCKSSQSPACREVFVYSLDSETLSCASCNPTGQQPLGDSNLSLLRPGPSRPTGPPFPQPRNLARDGSGRLFFESQDELSPRDVNGHIQDVYGWEPNGVGSCEEPEGCVSLISSGTSSVDSMFVDASTSGNDAFFITRQRLLPRDKDDLLDLYDARVGGGIQEPVEPPCSGEECPAAPASPPSSLPFGSDEFTGPNNPAPPKPKPCKKGFVKKHGKCVKKKPKKHHKGGSK